MIVTLGICSRISRRRFRLAGRRIEAEPPHPLDWGGALLARIEHSEQRLLARIEHSEQRIQDREQRLHAELARYTKAIFESMSTLVFAPDR